MAVRKAYVGQPDARVFRQRQAIALARHPLHQGFVINSSFGNDVGYLALIVVRMLTPGSELDSIALADSARRADLSVMTIAGQDRRRVGLALVVTDHHLHACVVLVLMMFLLTLRVDFSLFAPLSRLGDHVPRDLNRPRGFGHDDLAAPFINGET